MNEGLGVLKCRRHFFTKARQVQSCFHEIVFVGRKNMEHIVRNVRKQISSQPTRLCPPNLRNKIHSLPIG